MPPTHKWPGSSPGADDDAAQPREQTTIHSAQRGSAAETRIPLEEVVPVPAPVGCRLGAIVQLLWYH